MVKDVAPLHFTLMVMGEILVRGGGSGGVISDGEFPVAMSNGDVAVGGRHRRPRRPRKLFAVLRRREGVRARGVCHHGLPLPPRSPTPSPSASASGSAAASPPTSQPPPPLRHRARPPMPPRPAATLPFSRVSAAASPAGRRTSLPQRPPPYRRPACPV